MTTPGKALDAVIYHVAELNRSVLVAEGLGLSVRLAVNGDENRVSLLVEGDYRAQDVAVGETSDTTS